MNTLALSSAAMLSSLAVIAGTPILTAEATPATVVAQLDDAGQLLNRGADKFDTGDIEGAIADFTEAIRLEPNYSLAYYNRGRAYSELDQKQEAIDDYTKALEVNQRWGNLGPAAAFVNRGNARDDLGDDEGALRDYADALRINPNYGLAYENRGITYARRREFRLARQDWLKAANLYRQQGQERAFQRVMNNLRRLPQ